MRNWHEYFLRGWRPLRHLVAGEFLPSEATTGRVVNHVQKPALVAVLGLTFVEAVGLLIQVAVQVKRRTMDLRAFQATFQ